MTNYNIKYAHLTSVAREAVEELVEVYKASLVEKAYQIARNRSPEEEEISLRDILEAQESETKKLKLQMSLKEEDINKRKGLTSLFALGGYTYALTGFSIFIFQHRSFSLHNDLGLILSVFGAFIVLLASFYNNIETYKNFKYFKKRAVPFLDNYDIVKRWQTIETLTLSVMKSNALINQKSNPVSQIINYLVTNFTTSETESLSIRGLLKVRNKILHEEYDLSDDEKKKYITLADNIIEKLERLQQ